MPANDDFSYGERFFSHFFTSFFAQMTVEEPFEYDSCFS